MGMGTISFYPLVFIISSWQKEYLNQCFPSEFKLSAKTFVQACQSSIFLLKSFIINFLVMVNSSGRKMMFAVVQAEHFFEEQVLGNDSVCTKTKLVMCSHFCWKEIQDKIFLSNSFIRLKSYLQFLLNLQPSSLISNISLFLWIEMQCGTRFRNALHN